MKTLWLLFIFLTLHKVVHNVHTDNRAISVSLLEDVVLNCRIDFNSESDSFRWRRGLSIIAHLFALKKRFQNNKFQITGEHSKGEYNLKILNITTEDLGEYVCEAQISNAMSTTNYTLKLAEYTSTTSNEISSTQDNTAKGDKMENISAAFDDTRTPTENTFFVLSTDSHIHMDFKNATHNETGQSFGEIPYYSLLAVVLVIVLSILSVACIHKNCRTVVVKPAENLQQDNELNAQVHYPEEQDAAGRLDDGIGDESTHYATINEGEMMTAHAIAELTDSTNKPKQNFSVTEIIEDEVKHNGSKELMDLGNVLINVNQTETVAIQKDTPSMVSKFDANDDHIPYPRVGNISLSDRSSNDCDELACSNTDDYLHPYTTLNANDMEYLNSYSTIINADQAIDVKRLQLDDSDKMTFLRQVITQDENPVNLEILESEKCLKAAETTFCNNADYTDGFSANPISK